ncbi:MAG: MBL fold metallo-hydrolase [Verrucomicrobia bacterium]|nr:MAG: MBL fold metallo-hydrolase [Verrucomicrobiota bacterium]
MRIQFLGGVETVTGSQHLIEAGGRRVLRDCGLFQGRRDEARKINTTLRCPPNTLDAVVLSHAHIDHCGNLPMLARGGYTRPIHATTATVELAAVMLRDAARIQEQDAAYLNQKTNRRGIPAVEPLYTSADAEAAIKLFQGHRYGETIEPAPGIKILFQDAGHILGSALNVFELAENGKKARVGFALDLGRKDLPIIRDPETMRDLDLLVLESTYGDRLHDDVARAEDELAAAINRTLARGGKVLIPSFALERAQEILYHLANLFAAGRVKKVPVYVDSPMTVELTRIFARHRDYFDAETQALFDRLGGIMRPDWVHFAATVEESKNITASTVPCVVIAPNGMCEHGRILHHLKHGIENPKNTILIVGFQAENTLGRRLVEGTQHVKIFGDDFTRRAEVVTLNAFSAHADRDELVSYVRQVQPRKIALVHGEPKIRAALATRLRGMQAAPVLEPPTGESVEL